MVDLQSSKPRISGARRCRERSKHLRTSRSTPFSPRKPPDHFKMWFMRTLGMPLRLFSCRSSFCPATAMALSSSFVLSRIRAPALRRHRASGAPGAPERRPSLGLLAAVGFTGRRISGSRVAMQGMMRMIGREEALPGRARRSYPSRRSITCWARP